MSSSIGAISNSRDSSFDGQPGRNLASFAALVATEGITTIHAEVNESLTRFAICSLVREKFTVPKMYPAVGTGALLGLLAGIGINNLRIVNTGQ
jgi:hypothetical protein